MVTSFRDLAVARDIQVENLEKRTHDAHNAAVAYKQALEYLETHAEMPSKLKTFINRYMQTVVFNE